MVDGDVCWSVRRSVLMIRSMRARTRIVCPVGGALARCGYMGSLCQCANELWRFFLGRMNTVPCAYVCAVSRTRVPSKRSYVSCCHSCSEIS
uniref:Uncharacterized protein n=1 Tax=Zea mays TaxID=4577 RepID=C0PJU5_MAIZE|nr:unknown [Zea mays]